MKFFFLNVLEISGMAFLCILLGCLSISLGFFFFIILLLSLILLRKRRFSLPAIVNEYESESYFIAPVSGKIIRISQTEKFKEIVIKMGLFDGWGLYLPCRSRVLNFGSQAQGKTFIPFWGVSKKLNLDLYDYDFIDFEGKKFYFYIYFYKKFKGNALFLEIDSGDIGQVTSCLGLFTCGGVIRLLVPNELNILVRKGMRVKGARSLIGEIEEPGVGNEHNGNHR
ncbi:MAG: hypothetical protein H6621_05335 [Halobacteriovoraceae bacterium]|nr:hypothetical protein [Halobacteriovoraceae bacterium]